MNASDILANSFVVTGGGVRLEQFRRCLSSAGLDANLVREWRWCHIPGEGSLGNAVAQYSLVRHALESKMPFLVVFEDDAVPCDDAAEKMASAFDSRDEETLCISLGWNYSSDGKEERGENRRVYGSHAYALFGEKAYVAYIEAWEKNGRADIVLGAICGSKMAKENLFAQYTPSNSESIHLPPGWSADAELEHGIDGEMEGRFAKAWEELEKIRKESEIHVAYTIDVQGQGAAQFMDQLVVSVYSLRESMSPVDRVVCHILYGNIPAELMRRLYAMQSDRFKVEFRPIKARDLEYMQSISNKKHDPRSNVRTWSGIVFARLWLPLALPDVDRVIYTDADTLVRKSMKPLWDTDLGGNLLGCPTGTVPEYGFYSGLMVMDCKAIREENAKNGLYSKLADHLGRYAHTYYLPDQTTINRFFAGRIKEVDRTWCVPPRPGYNDRNALANAAIWHFYEGGKPVRLGTDEFGAACLEWNEWLKRADAATVS